MVSVWLFSLGALLFWGVQTVCWAKSTAVIGARWSTVAHAAGSMLVGLCLLGVLVGRRASLPESVGVCGLGVVAGILGALGVLAFVLAMEVGKGHLMIVVAASAAYPVIPWLYELLILGKGFDWRHVVGVVLLVVAVALIQYRPASGS